MFAKASFIALLLSAAAVAGPAMAQDDTNPLSEIRAGVMAHDAYPVWLPTTPSDFRFDQIEDLGFDLLFDSPDIDAFRWLGSPRPNLGATVNFDGQESEMHLGLTWQAHLFDSPVYVEGTFGGAIHNGILAGTWGGDGTLRPQGCRVGFYSGIGLGMDITKNMTATLVYEHMSNADLCDYNFGLSNAGIKIGYKFD